MTETTATAITIAEFCAERFGSFRIIGNVAYDGFAVAEEARDAALAAIAAEEAHIMRALPTVYILEVVEEVEDMLTELCEAREHVFDVYFDARDAWLDMVYW